MYVQFLGILTKYIILPYTRIFKELYGNSIISILEVDMSMIRQRQVFYLSQFNVIYNMMRYYLFQKPVSGIHYENTIVPNTNMFYIVQYANGRNILTRTPRDNMPCPIKQKRKYLMVLVNNNIDITNFYTQTMGSITYDLGASAQDIAVLSLINKEDTTTLLSLNLNHSTTITAINDENFEETVFKATQIVVL
jgi:hypothetical protein